AAQFRLHFLHRAGGAQQFRFERIGNGYAELAAVAKVISNSLGKVVQIDDELTDPLPLEQLQMVLQQWFAANRHHYLRHIQSQRAQPRAEACGKNECLHARSRRGGTGESPVPPPFSLRYRDNNAHAFCIALARWLMRFFTSSESSANVFVWPSARKSGSYPNPPPPRSASRIVPLQIPSAQSYNPFSSAIATTQRNRAVRFS